MKISFIIPARNEASTLKHTVANLFRTCQAYQIEVIVIDDASDEEMSRFLDSSPNLICIRNPQRVGVSKSRNIGAHRATGDLFIFLDAHVCFNDHWLDEIMSCSDLFDQGIFGPTNYHILDMEVFKKTCYEGIHFPVDQEQVFYGLYCTSFPDPNIIPNHVRKTGRWFEVPIIYAACLMVTQKIFNELGGFENELTGFGSSEDTEFAIRCWAFGYRVHVIPSVCCYHYYSPERYAKPGSADYEVKPFFSDKYEGSEQNALRIIYLHTSDETFRTLLHHHSDHPEFSPDLERIVTDKLRKRREMIRQKSVRDESWLIDRLGRV